MKNEEYGQVKTSVTIGMPSEDFIYFLNATYLWKIEVVLGFKFFDKTQKIKLGN